MSENDALRVVDEQHRRFFRYTGWLMTLGGLGVFATGLMFLRTGRESGSKPRRTQGRK